MELNEVGGEQMSQKNGQAILAFSVSDQNGEQRIPCRDFRVGYVSGAEKESNSIVH